MSLSVQSSTAAQIALDNLANRSETAQAGGGAQSAAKTGDGAASPSSIWSIDLAAASASGGDDNGLGAASSAADAAVSAGQVIADLLSRMRQAAATASDPSVTGAQRNALNNVYQFSLARIGDTLSQAQAGGVNLVDGSQTGDVQVGGATLSPADLTPGGSLIGLSANTNLLDPSSAAAAAGALGQAIASVGQAVDKLAGQSQAIQGHLDLLSQASGGAAGVSGAVDQDGARLLSLMVQQQLSGGGFSVANQVPQAILALFR